MIFASGIFLFIFLPAMLIGYWLLRNRSVTIRNAFLLLMSAGFYLESGLGQMILLFLSITFNYLFARGIANAAEADNDNRKKSVFIFAIAYNIGMLFVFKYLAFIGGEINTLFSNPLIPDRILSITLPLGISFYTFQALSYVVDVYRDSSLVERNPINVALYISFFPQLIAGPIVRWESIRNDLRTKIRIGGGIITVSEDLHLGLARK